MKMNLITRCLIGAIMGGMGLGQAADSLENKLILPPLIAELPSSSDFTVKVRTTGHDWQEIPVYLAKVAKVVNARLTPQDTSFASFDFSGEVDVSVTVNHQSLESSRVRPLSYGIKTTVQANTINFSLLQPRNLSIEINGDIFHNLQLFANPVEASVPLQTDPNVIYFASGVHHIGLLKVPSGKTVYIAAGALIDGGFVMTDVERVKVCGHGIIHAAKAKPFLLESAKDVTIDGPIVLPANNTATIADSQDIVIENIKSFSAGGNNDGLDIFCSSNIAIDGVFMRNSDDCIAIYGHRWKYYGNVTHVTVKNSSLWADVAHPILVGTHGDIQNPDTLSDLHFLNLDILDENEAQLDYQGCMSLNAGDCNLIQNVSFENIRVEDFRQGQLVNLRVMFNHQYNKSPGRGIQDILFKNITYNGSHANISIIAGYDDTRNISNVTFENLSINGRIISDTMPEKPGFYKTGDMARIFVGEHVNGLTFRADAGKP